MAVHTALSGGKGTGCRAELGIGGVANTGMALLTQLRCLNRQHGFVDAAMHLMATGAVICYRGVFPEFGTAFFGVAGIAILIDAHLLKAGLTQASVGIVAVTAHHLAVFDWMTGALVDIGLLFEMTRSTHLDFGGSLLNRILGSMDQVAACAGNVSAVVMAAFPGHTLVVLMAGKAHAVLFVGGDRGVFTEGDHRFLTALVVVAHRAVAGFALEIGHGGRAGVGTAVDVVEQRHDGCALLVAHQTAVSTLWGVLAFGELFVERRLNL